MTLHWWWCYTRDRFGTSYSIFIILIRLPSISSELSTLLHLPLFLISHIHPVFYDHPFAPLQFLLLFILLPHFLHLFYLLFFVYILLLLFLILFLLRFPPIYHIYHALRLLPPSPFLFLDFSLDHIQSSFSYPVFFLQLILSHPIIHPPILLPPQYPPILPQNLPNFLLPQLFSLFFLWLFIFFVGHSSSYYSLSSISTSSSPDSSYPIYSFLFFFLILYFPNFLLLLLLFIPKSFLFFFPNFVFLLPSRCRQS